MTYGGGSIKKKINTQDLVFLDSLLREMQKEEDLVEGVNFVLEFTPTNKRSNYEFLDRSHIAISYDDNRFRFDIGLCFKFHFSITNPPI